MIGLNDRPPVTLLFSTRAGYPHPGINQGSTECLSTETVPQRWRLQSVIQSTARQPPGVGIPWLLWLSPATCDHTAGDPRGHPCSIPSVLYPSGLVERRGPQGTGNPPTDELRESLQTLEKPRAVPISRRGMSKDDFAESDERQDAWVYSMRPAPLHAPPCG